MNAEKQAEILNLLDFERRTVIYPGVTRSKDLLRNRLGVFGQLGQGRFSQGVLPS